MNFAEEFEKQFKDIKKVREATKDVIQKGGKLALEEYHDAKSVERIKKLIRKS